MTRLLGFLCAALLFASAPARAADRCDATDQRPAAQSHQKNDKPQTGPSSGRQGPKKWWIDSESRAELGITDQQSAAIEKEWQRSLEKRAETRERLEKAEGILEKMILDAADEAAVTAQLDKVEAARSEANKARVLLLYRINKILTQDQRIKVDAKAKAMRERDGRRGGGPR
jgi:Spy/CpxP family protein refolding chaperone